MRKSGWSTVAALVLAAACGSQVDSKVIEARKAPCTTLCDRMAECPGELPTPAFATREECLSQCTEIGGSMDFHWGRTRDLDKDMCAEQWTAQIDCLANLTCEERKEETFLRTYEKRCGKTLSASSDCSRAYKDGGQ